MHIGFRWLAPDPLADKGIGSITDAVDARQLEAACNENRAEKNDADNTP